MQRKTGSFVFVLLILMGILLGNVFAQFFTAGTINPAGIFGVLIGVGLAVFIHFYSRKKPLVRGIGSILIALLIPLPFAGLISYMLSLFPVDITITIFGSIYLVGLLVAMLILFGSAGNKVFAQDVPGYDERQLSHFAWGGAWSFLVLFFLLIGALIQPWIELGEQGLWIGILLAGFLFWLATNIVLELKK